VVEQEEENDYRNDADNEDFLYINSRVVDVLKETTP
jgi:hypothetical protein